MTFTLTREQAYALVWSNPMLELSKLVGISNVALANTFRKAGIPLPGRGYWAKLEAGKQVKRDPLPPADLATVEYVIVGGALTGEIRQKISGEPGEKSGPLEDIEVLAARFRKRLGAVSAPKSLHSATADINLLLAKDEKIRQQRDSQASDHPVYAALYKTRFESPEARRRLRLMDAIFKAVEGVGGHGNVRANDETKVSITLAGRGLAVDIRLNDTKLTVEFGKTYDFDSGKSQNATAFRGHWEDTKTTKLEDQLTEIVVNMAIAVEVSAREWREGVRRRREQDRIETARLARIARDHQKAEAKRVLEEREKVRIENLVSSAQGLQQAGLIRTYVGQVRASLENQMDRESVEVWCTWALGQADKLDPLMNGTMTQLIDELKIERSSLNLAKLTNDQTTAQD